MSVSLKINAGGGSPLSPMTVWVGAAGALGRSTVIGRFMLLWPLLTAAIVGGTLATIAGPGDPASRPVHFQVAHSGRNASEAEPQCRPTNHLSSINPQLAIRAIVGEAANQGERGMLAVACAIRNRGHLRGVYGVNSRILTRQPDWIWQQARVAWQRSAAADITHGATHWENVQAFGRPHWASGMKATVIIGSHTFFRATKKQEKQP